MSDTAKLAAAKDDLDRDDVTQARVAELESQLQAAKAQLLQSETSLRLALEIGQLGSYERNLQTNHVEMTDLALKALGIPASDHVTGDEIRQSYDPRDAERVGQAVATAIEGKTVFDIEHRVVKPDGTQGALRVRGRAVYDAGKPVRLVAVTQDITERKRLEEERHSAERRQGFLLSLNDRLRDVEKPDAAMDATTECLGQHLGVTLAGYGEMVKDHAGEVTARQWSADSRLSEVRIFSLEEFLPGVEQLEAGGIFNVDNVDMDPRFSDAASRAIFERLGARALLALPLLINQRLGALLYVASAQPRNWSAEDVSLLQDAAERTRTAVQRTRAELAWRESDAQFRIIAESLPALVWIVSPDLELRFSNERWLNYSGFPREVALGHSWMTTIYKDDLEKIKIDFVDVLANQAPYEAEARYRSASGEYRWHIVRAAPLHGPTGEFMGWCGTSVDIHDIKQTANALRESEERLSLAQRAVSIGVCDWDIPSGRTTWNAEQERLFGFEPGSFTNEYDAWENRLYPDDREPTKKIIEAAIMRQEPHVNFSHRVSLPTGEIRHIEVNARFFYDIDGTPLRMVAVHIDITRYKEAEQRQHLLIRELHHRVKNTLATVQAIVGSTARSTSSIDEFYQSFVGRIVSLARTHNILTEDYWQKAGLEDLIRIELGPYDDVANKRVFISGPPVELPSEAAVPVGMAIHELTTNAAKHGALSSFGGKVDVRWSVDEEGDRPILHFSWNEHGGPPVKPPTRQGFGSRLLQRVLTTQLGADVKIGFHADGIRFRMTMPIPAHPPTPTLGT